jgi:hypothetical protein
MYVANSFIHLASLVLPDAVLAVTYLVILTLTLTLILNFKH